ncbi:cell wall-binding repeat-containing protein [Rossellomorea arthrocnemi]
MSGGGLVEASGKTVDRVSGTNRYDTSVKVSQQGWPGGADTVVIAVGDNFPDALAGAPLAHKMKAPILLVSNTSIPGNVNREIDRLNVKNAYILGGQSVVSLKIEQQLESKGLVVKRVAGKDRYATASKIAEIVGGNKAVVTYGENFPDSLSIASYAASKTMPILLTDTNALPDSTKKSLQNYDSTIVVGGNKVVSDKVYRQLPGPKRITGSDRYDTATKVVKTLYSASASNDTVVATGESFADALTGSVMAAKNNEPIMLIESDSVPEVVKETISDYDIHNFTIIGGTSVVTDYAEKMLTFDPSVIIETAKNYIGTPYKWGGTTPSGFDCSGYIGYVYKKHGINVSRTTTGIWNDNPRVSQPAVGDLVVFSTYKPGPSHVGIYMGDNKFIHSGDRGVEVTSMNNVYFKPRYMGAVRVVN